ncbi:MAG TPA: hypothetical protein VJX71_08005 [Methylomirabilota bacterium]|nr:hypothetical protein [Methylomirabilota bacterium]
MDETLKAIITYVVTFAGGYLSRYVEPRAKLVHWFPGWVTFAVPLPAAASGAAPLPAPAAGTVNVSTHTLTVQNVGWRPASRIEILHGQAPQLFRFVPQVNFTQGVTPAGEHVITIESLAPREWVALHVLTVGNFPPLRTVRSVEGPSTLVTTRQTFVISKVRRRVLETLIVLGAATAIYWFWRIASRALPPAWNFIWQ